MPAQLTPQDLNPIRKIVGDNALEYMLVICGFHFVNRIADQLGVGHEMLPQPLRQYGFFRQLSVKILGFFMKMMDLSNRVYNKSYEDVLHDISQHDTRKTSQEIGDACEILKPKPMLLECIGMMLTDLTQSSLEIDIIAKVQQVVEASLPKSIQDVEGFHPRPEHPVEDFAFVGTRYAYRTTKEMIDSLKNVGYDDHNILDLAIAVADANFWARFSRMLNLDPDLFYIRQ